MSVQELRDLAQKLGKNGVFYVTITGGEPFLNKERLYQFMDALKEQNIRIMINSNGTLIDNDEAQKLSEYPIDIFLVSLISHDPKQHDEIAKMRNSH